MELDAVFLSRLQFALTISFHYLFPPLTIGLSGVIVVLEALYLLRREPIYETAARFWTRLFAVNFALGVATGIVMEFQFGTNWATYSRFVGDVFGSALAAEGIFAFFLESGFLAVLVFGWDRVSPTMHFIAALMVAIGGVFSSVWIVVANSWQQTPAGHRLVEHDGVIRAETVDFWAMVFNPSSVVRLSHTLVGAGILGAFFVLSISAWYLLRRPQHAEFARRSFTVALWFGAVFSILAVVTGDWSAKVVAEHQPAKLAAMEGHFTTGPGHLTILGWPDVEGRRTPGLAIPGGLSFLTHWDFERPVTGLDQIPREDWPPIPLTFLSFRVMVALGIVFLVLSLGGLVLLWRKKLFETRWILWVYVPAVLGPYLANQAGWTVAEVGRQPWTVYGLLRTADSVSKSVRAEHVLASIIGFGLVYALLFFVWLWIMNDKIQHGPDPVHMPEHTTLEGYLEAGASKEDPSRGSSLVKPEPHG